MARHVDTCWSCNGPVVVPHDPMECALRAAHGLRQRVAGWHFAQDVMSKTEKEILHVAEQLDRALAAAHTRLDAALQREAGARAEAARLRETLKRIADDGPRQSRRPHGE